jgi:hypothetical protein
MKVHCYCLAILSLCFVFTGRMQGASIFQANGTAIAPITNNQDGDCDDDDDGGE